MFNLDLKRASVALAASRLDDAFAVLTTSAERTHRDAQTLIDQLADRFVERAQQHLAANRLQDAGHDADRAKTLVGNRLDVSEVIAAVQAKTKDVAARQNGRQQILNEIQKQANAGQFSLGQNLLTNLTTDELSLSGQAAAQQADQLLKHRRQITEHVLAQLHEASQTESAAALLNRVHKLTVAEQSHPQVTAIRDSAIESICDGAVQAIKEGRIDKAANAMDSIHGWQHPSISELKKLMSYCSQTNAAIQRGDFLSAETQLRLLNQLVNAKWINVALKQIQTMAEHRKELQSGPLGLFSQLDQTVLESPPASTNLALPSPPLLSESFRSATGRVIHVDGIGSFLLQTKNSVSIGAVSQSHPVDIEVLTEGLSEPVVIRRAADDYFAESRTPFVINGKQTQRHLLQDGDTIAIGQRARMKFSKPVTASSSAVLTISGASLKRRDIRHIVLLADSLLFGAAGCHFKLPGTTTPVLLHRSGEDLAIRELGSEPQILQPGNPTSLQHVRFALM